MPSLERLEPTAPKQYAAEFPGVRAVLKLREIPQHLPSDVVQVYLGGFLARYANEMEMPPAKLVEIALEFGGVHFQEAMRQYVDRIKRQGGRVA